MLKRKRASSVGLPLKKRKIVAVKKTYNVGRSLTTTPKSELKAFDTSISSNAFDVAITPPVTSTLNTPVNGAELYQRVGRKIYMKNLHIRGFIENIVTSIQDVGRIIVYYDSQPNGAIPVIGTLLRDSNAAATLSGLSEINLDNRQRFQILRDYQVLLPACTNTAGVLTNLTIMDPIKNTFNVDFFIKLKGMETVYNAVNGGTIADITSGAINMICLSTNTSNVWTFSWSSRLRYYD